MAYRIKVLYVEDHPDTLEITRFTLNRKGFEVLTAVDVATGIQVGTDNEFDILVTDIGLPDGTGLDILSGLRMIKTFPAIAISGYGMGSDIDKHMVAGFDHYIVKPYEGNSLVNSINEVYASHTHPK